LRVGPQPRFSGGWAPGAFSFRQGFADLAQLAVQQEKNGIGHFVIHWPARGAGSCGCVVAPRGLRGSSVLDIQMLGARRMAQAAFARRGAEFEEMRQFRRHFAASPFCAEFFERVSQPESGTENRLVGGGERQARFGLHPPRRKPTC
jgi:hypothetical protein